MDKDNRIQHGFRLRVAGKEQPTIFFWPILPDNILDLHQLESGGTNVSVRLPNGDSVTHNVLESINEIQLQIARCRELDKVCQHENHNSTL